MRGLTAAVGITVLLGSPWSWGAEPGQIGGAALPLQLESLLQAPEGTSLAWEALRGHVVVLEFWATWCAPCVAALPHLNELAQRLSGEPVRFVAIAWDKEEAVRHFLLTHRIEGWVGLDPPGAMFAGFGLDALPSTILVDAQGIVRAVTEPLMVTEAALRDVLADRTPELPRRKSSREVMAEFVRADGEDSLFRVEVRPSALSNGLMTIDGGRFAAVGIPVRSLLLNAYDVSTPRLVAPADLPERLYDVLVLAGQRTDLVQTLIREAIEGALGLQSRREQREVDVYILTASPESARRLTPSAATNQSSRGGSGRVEGTGLTLDDLARRLEGASNMPVVNETGLAGAFDVKLEWDPERPESMLEVVRDQLGLELRKARREIEMVVVERIKVE